MDAVNLIERILSRLKREASNYKALAKLEKENERLARLCIDIENIIMSWSFDELAKLERRKSNEKRR